MKRRFAVVLAACLLCMGLIPLSAAESAVKEPVIPGLTINRKTGGGYLGLEIVGGVFKLSFYDQAKKPLAVDFPRALLRWDVTYKNVPERLILSAGADGRHLTSPRTVRPPYNFQLFITLISDDTAKESETYVLRFRQ